MILKNLMDIWKKAPSALTLCPYGRALTVSWAKDLVSLLRAVPRAAFNKSLILEFQGLRPFRRPSLGIVFEIFLIIFGNVVRILFFQSGVFDIPYDLVRWRGPTMKISLILSRLKFS